MGIAQVDDQIGGANLRGGDKAKTGVGLWRCIKTKAAGAKTRHVELQHLAKRGGGLPDQDSQRHLRLRRPDQPDNGAHHACGRATGGAVRQVGEHGAQGWGTGAEPADIAVKSKGRGADQRYPGDKAGVRQDVAGGKAIGAVQHKGVASNQRSGICRIKGALHCVDLAVGVQLPQGRGGGVYLGLADVIHAKQRLPVQVGQGHGVRIDQRQMSGTRPNQILQHRRGQPASADDKHTGGADGGLTCGADLGQDFLAAIAAHRVAASQARTRASGSVCRVISVTADTVSAPAAKAPAARSMVMPPMAIRGV